MLASQYNQKNRKQSGQLLKTVTTMLNQIFSDESVILSVNYTNGFVTLEIPQIMEIELSSGILSLLGLKHRRLAAERHIGHKMGDIAKA